MENTKKFLRAILATSLSIFLFVASSYPASAQVDYSVLKRGVVKIIAYKPKNVEDTGAGIVVGVDDNLALILTALHVVTYEEENQLKQAQRIEVKFFGKRYMEFTGRLHEDYQEDLDMAVIVVDPVEGKTLPSDLPNFTLGDVSKLKEGDRVSTIGHPPDFEWEASINTNIIQGLNYGGDSRKFRFTTTAIERGHSGGPVFNEQGSLVGMVTRLHPSNTIALKINAGIYLLESWRIPTTNLAHPLAFGTIVVDSKPSGGQVFLDGQPKGSTTAGPLSIDELEVGSYSLRVTKEGYTPWEQSVDVESGKELSIVAQLEPWAKIMGKIRYNDEVVTKYSNAMAVAELMDTNSLEVVSIDFEYDNRAGQFTIGNVPPGQYFPYIRLESGYPFDSESPGDFTSRIGREWTAAPPHLVKSDETELEAIMLLGLDNVINVPPDLKVIQKDVVVRHIIHLTRPVDSQKPRTLVSSPPEILYQSLYPSAGIFEWDPVPGAISYKLHFSLVDGNTHQPIDSETHTVASTHYSPNLNVSSGNNYYRFYMQALNSKNESIGTFMNYCEDGFGDYFEFEVALDSSLRQRWRGTIDLHQGDTGTLEFIREGSAITEGWIEVHRGEISFPRDEIRDGFWDDHVIAFRRILDPPTSYQPFKGTTSYEDGRRIIMEGRFAANYAGRWTAKCELVEESAPP